MIVQCGEKSKMLSHLATMTIGRLMMRVILLFAYRDDLEQDRLVVGVYDYHATDRIEETDTAIIDQPVTGETAMPDESVHPTPRMGDSDIETPINDPNHLRNL